VDVSNPSDTYVVFMAAGHAASENTARQETDMQARGQTLFSRYRFTGLAMTVALATGILIGGQVDVSGALPGGSSTQHESAMSAAPLFLVGDVDGLYHQQQATTPAVRWCDTSESPVFIGGDSDGLANPAVNALIPTARCDDAQR
jgi:hypothetical protein